MPAPWNVLVIVLDDVGVEKLGFTTFGATDVPPTPRLDAIAAQGVVFRHGYANPICGPTRAALLTGRYGFRTGMGTNMRDIDAPPEYRLPLREVLLPELVKLGAPGSGYRCAAFGKWHVTYAQGDDLHPNKNGFDHFAGHLPNTFSPGNGNGHFHWRRVIDGASSFVSGPPFDETQWVSSVVRQAALDWIHQQGRRPWLAYVAFNPPHAPWNVPPSTLLSDDTLAELEAAGFDPGHDVPNGAPLEERLLAYHAMIEATDTDVGRLLDGLSPAMLAETMVIVVGDNGTPGDVIAPPYVPQHAKRSLYQQGIHVPFLAMGPLVAAPGRTSDALVHVVDVWRTVAEITGANPVLAGAPKADSVSFLPVLQSAGALPPRSRVFCETFKPNGTAPTLIQRSYQDAEYKYMVVGANERFFHYLDDEMETVDLVQSGMTPDENARFVALRAEMKALLAS